MHSQLDPTFVQYFLEAMLDVSNFYENLKKWSKVNKTTALDDTMKWKIYRPIFHASWPLKISGCNDNFYLFAIH